MYAVGGDYFVKQKKYTFFHCFFKEIIEMEYMWLVIQKFANACTTILKKNAYGMTFL